VSLEEWRERLEHLGANDRVRGILLTIGSLHAGVTSLENLRVALERYLSRGKRLVAFLPTTTLLTYYLASVADTIVVPESGELALLGLRVEATFLRAALDRLGILPQFHHIAEYKSAVNRFLYPAMPAPQREMVSSLVDSTFTEIVAAIAKSRGLAVERVREAIDQGILNAMEAHDRHLIDTVAFEDELPKLFGKGNTAARMLPWETARSRIRLRYRWRLGRPEAIGVVQIVGMIVTGESQEFPIPVPFFGRSLVGHETVARAFRLAERSAHIKALVHVDSPGGSAVASDLIWREVARVQRRKPVVVHMGTVAGSGGYYVGCAAQHIVAGATTLTGSIGVVTGKFNVEGLLSKGGMHHEIIARGETATMDSAFASFTDHEWRALRQSAQDIYQRFKARVAIGRKRSTEEIERVARGRVWTGRQALEHGLVDELGDLTTAVHNAKRLAHIPPERDVPVVTIAPPRATPIPISGIASAFLDGLGAIADLLAERALLLMPPDMPT
jgi:protease-4